MEQLRNHDTGDTPKMIKQWRNIIRIGGYAAILAFLLTLTDIIFGSVSSGNLSELPQTALEKFFELKQNSLLGLYHLDLLNNYHICCMVSILSIWMWPIF